MIVLMTVFTGLFAFADDVPDEITEAFQVGDDIFNEILYTTEYSGADFNDTEGNLYITKSGQLFYWKRLNNGGLRVFFWSGEDFYVYNMNGTNLVGSIHTNLLLAFVGHRDDNIDDIVFRYERLSYSQDHIVFFRNYIDLANEKEYKVLVD